jgi:3-hydroxyisobutyrate dehydrogenase
LAANGGTVANSPREAAENAEVVVSMVADDNASRALWFGEDGALAGAKPGTVCIERSTLAVGWVNSLATAAQKRECGFFDAPMTGSKAQAASGELKFLIGGEAAVLEADRPLLGAMGKIVVHVGPTDSGASAQAHQQFCLWRDGHGGLERIPKRYRPGIRRKTHGCRH